MTFKDLQKLVHSQQPELGQSEILRRLRDKPFWIWDKEDHKRADNNKTNRANCFCCFNHIIGLPTKDGVRKPLFDYERMLYRALVELGYLNSGTYNNVVHDFKVKHLW